MKTTSPAGGSAGSEVNAGGCCPALTDTGSFSGRNMRLERVWTEFRTTRLKAVTESVRLKPYGRKHTAQQQAETSC